MANGKCASKFAKKELYRQSEVVVGAKIEQRLVLALNLNADGLFGRNDALSLVCSRIGDQFELSLQDSSRRS